ncbi:unnamed protein product, partial [Heterosigma akashiwo]
IYQQRQDAVVDAFLWAWKGYKTYAWGQDELKPISKSSQNWLGLGLTLVDSLDTMWLMGLHDEFAEAQEWVENELSFDKDVEVNFFETTIRVLGGLLSGQILPQRRGDPILLLLYHNLILALQAFHLSSMLSSDCGAPASPASSFTILPKKARPPEWGALQPSEVSSVQLEFRYLARLTGNATFPGGGRAAMGALGGWGQQRVLNFRLVPFGVGGRAGEFPAAHGGGGGNGHGVLTLGARADSYYEYLLKQWLASGRDPGDAGLRDQATHTSARQASLSAPTAGIVWMRVSSWPFLAFAFLIPRQPMVPHPKPRQVLFPPGTLALGHRAGLGPSTGAGGGRAGGEGCHLELAVGLLDTCLRMYNATATRLSPEIACFETSDSGFDPSDQPLALLIKPGDAHNILRPETVESLYYLYKMTGEPYYQEAGWAIFCAFEKHTRVDGTGGYAGLKDIDRPPAQGGERIDKMESFFLAETLKYFFLLFADPDEEDVLPLDEFVFNTEAHPLPI